MKWDGFKFAARLQVPEGCEYGSIGIISNEKSYLAAMNFLPRTPDDSTPPGAFILGMNQGGHDRKNWEADIKSDMSRMSDRGWVDKNVWGLRFIAMRNLTAEQLQADIKSAEREKETPGLLQSLSGLSTAVHAWAKCPN